MKCLTLHTLCTHAHAARTHTHCTMHHSHSHARGHTFVHEHTHTHVRAHTHTHAQPPTHTHTLPHTYTYTHTHTYTANIHGKTMTTKQKKVQRFTTSDFRVYSDPITVLFLPDNTPEYPGQLADGAIWTVKSMDRNSDGYLLMAFQNDSATVRSLSHQHSVKHRGPRWRCRHPLASSGDNVGFLTPHPPHPRGYADNCTVAIRRDVILFRHFTRRAH